MLALLLAAVIANAFILLRLSPSNFYKLHRYDGQLLYIKATFIGIFFTAAAYLLNGYFSITVMLSDLLSIAEPTIFTDKEHLVNFFIFFFFSAFLSFLYCGLERLFLLSIAFYKFRGTDNISYRQMAKILLMYKLLKDSPLDKLLYLSYVQNKFLLITMSDRKVYVGRVISLGEPNESQGPDQEICIVPVFSGYRDKDTLSVSLNNIYAGISEVDDAYLVLKQDNIVSACEFIESLYHEFSGRKTTPTSSGKKREVK